MGALIAINFLNAGVIATIESQPGPPAQFRLNLSYGGNPSIRVSGNLIFGQYTEFRWRWESRETSTAGFRPGLL
jgi:hypothetical protein